MALAVSQSQPSAVSNIPFAWWIRPCLWTGAAHVNSEFFRIVSLANLENHCSVTSLSVSSKMSLNHWKPGVSYDLKFRSGNHCLTRCKLNLNFLQLFATIFSKCVCVQRLLILLPHLLVTSELKQIVWFGLITWLSKKWYQLVIMFLVIMKLNFLSFQIICYLMLVLICGAYEVILSQLLALRDSLQC